MCVALGGCLGEAAEGGRVAHVEYVHAGVLIQLVYGAMF